MEMTGKRKRMQTVTVLALGLAIMLAALTQRLDVAYGAAGIDTEKKDCRILFTLDADVLSEAGELDPAAADSSDYLQYYSELSEALEGTGEAGEKAIEVKLFRVAQIKVDGSYEALAGYREALDGLEKASSTTTAGQWSDWALAAAEAVAGKEPDAETQIRRTDDGKVSGAAENLAVGLYLVSVEPLMTDIYQYSFIPYLISLPNNYYGRTGDDTWNYGDDDENPVYVGLKPERQDRYGDLVIEKKLTSYNETLKGASFVFEVKAVKENRLVYSDVVSLVFGKYGTERVTLEHIPAGADVTVTEVYSGASYSPVPDGAYVRGTVIQADDAVKVSFENQYDEHLRAGSTSVVNHFLYEKTEGQDGQPGSDSLDWEKLENGNNDRS